MRAAPVLLLAALLAPPGASAGDLGPEGPAAAPTATGSDGSARPPPEASPGEPAWKVVRRGEEPGREYLLERRATGSGLSEYRITAEFDAPAEEVAMAVLHDMRDVENSRFRAQLVSEGPVELVIYQRIDLPLISDRDVTTRIEFWYEAASGAYVFSWRDASERGPAPIDGVVRLPRVEGGLEVTPLGRDRCRLVRRTYAEFGGFIPAWLVNSQMGGSMVEDVIRLRALVAAGGYERARFRVRESPTSPLHSDEAG